MNETEKKWKLKAWQYCVAMTGLLIIICAILGHPLWAITAFFQNVFGEISGESSLSAANVLIASASRMDINSFPNFLLAALPAAVQLGCIDDFVSKYLLAESDDRASKVFRILGTYLLMTLIAVCWTTPATWEMFKESKWLSRFFLIYFVCVIIRYVVYLLFHGITKESDKIFNSQTIGVLLQLFLKVLEEYFKSFLLCLIYFILLALPAWYASKEAYHFLMIPLRIISPLVYLTIFLALKNPIERIATFIAGLFLQQCAKDEQDNQSLPIKTFKGELFCLLLGVYCLIGGVVLHFV